jgi:hypothetical protein
VAFIQPGPLLDDLPISLVFGLVCIDILDIDQQVGSVLEGNQAIDNLIALLLLGEFSSLPILTL